MQNSWSGKNVTVLGLGRSGISTAQYLRKRGATVLVSERAEADGSKTGQIEELKAMGAQVETGGHSEQAISGADLIVVSPGIPPTAEVIVNARQQGKDIICDIELAAREAGAKVPIIGITGTNGKSTTCALISFILEQSGLSAPACGNFGVPILGQLEKSPDYLVAEVSSYQLYYCPTFAPNIGVWLNLTPDHLAWHGGLEWYIEAKKQMFLHQLEDQYAVLNADDPIVSQFMPPSEIFSFSVESDLNHCIQAAFISDGYLCYRYTGQTKLVCAIDEMKIMGKHNLENALAAIAVAVLAGVEHAVIQRAVTSFTALEHRLEYVATIDGVEFFNDSKATNPASTIKALEAFGQRKVVLIAGGRDKGTDLNELVSAAKQHVSELILLGEAKERFESAFKDAGYQNIRFVGSLDEAIEVGASVKKGPVILSPACASFDMFKDYEERGRVFKDLVRARLEKVARAR